jgi:hypothetical protein
MELLNNTVINNAKVLRMCKNCLVLELPSNKEIFITRKVFNEIRKNPDIPMYRVLHEFLGVERAWVAIPMTI